MNPDTLLYRMVHPHWLHTGQPDSRAFRPTEKDAGQLSVYDGDLINPQAAWEHYTRELKLFAAGVVAVTVSECLELGLAINADPTPYPEHTLIDFSRLTSPGEIHRKARALNRAATARGWQFIPPDNAIPRTEASEH